ncbi:helix-turn-helix domain-containing protein [Paenibacillus yanchengensis]|uniref:Helix-turn-helix domain-containing protein n=1 Tax=Paenibacillus yanchengensis TaxID=2035833 RepID=A0ABW4YGD9_9BACL
MNWDINRIVTSSSKQLYRPENNLELHVIVQGEAVYQCGEHRFVARAGGIVLFRPYETTYTIIPKQNQWFTCLRFTFSPTLIHQLPDGDRLLASFYSLEKTQCLQNDSIVLRSLVQAACDAWQVQQEEKNRLKRYAKVIDVLASLHALLREQLLLSEATDETGVYTDTSMNEAIAYIVEHANQDIDMQVLIRTVGKGKTQFYADFRKLVGLTPNRFVHYLRIQMAARLLKQSNLSITAIALECGYHSIPYFNKHFKQFWQQSPREFRNSQRATG